MYISTKYYYYIIYLILEFLIFLNQAILFCYVNCSLSTKYNADDSMIFALNSSQEINLCQEVCNNNKMSPLCCFPDVMCTQVIGTHYS